MQVVSEENRVQCLTLVSECDKQHICNLDLGAPIDKYVLCFEEFRRYEISDQHFVTPTPMPHHEHKHTRVRAHTRTQATLLAH
jgi:hypothetical protein